MKETLSTSLPTFFIAFTHHNLLKNYPLPNSLPVLRVSLPVNVLIPCTRYCKFAGAEVSRNELVLALGWSALGDTVPLVAIMYPPPISNLVYRL